MGLLRIILAITVVLAHSSSIYGFKFVGGQIAVQTFYIISGFYMTLILNEKYIGGSGSYKLFISNRFLRLFPVYWTVLLLTIICSLIIAMFSDGKNLGSFSHYVTYFDNMSLVSLIFLIFTNVFLFLQDIVMFLGLNTLTGNLFFTHNFRETSPMLYEFLFIPQAWTIGVEITFYLIAPFLVKRKLKFILLLIVLTLLLRVVLSFYFGLGDDPWSYRFFPTELVFFLLGIISYHVYKYIKKIEIKLLYLKIVWVNVLLFTLFYNYIPFPGKIYLYLLIFFISLPFIFILTKNWTKDIYIGELSYPIYISHILVLNCMKEFNFTSYGNLGLNLTTISIVFSIILNELIAKRIDKIRQDRVKKFS